MIPSGTGRDLEKVQTHHLPGGSARTAARLPVAAVAALSVLALVLAAAIWAWSHYGTTIFFEMIAAGIAACF